MPTPTTNTTRILPLGALAVLGLASCSLPADQAWRNIRREGLITYLMENGTPAQENTAPAGSQQMVAQSSSQTPASAPASAPAQQKSSAPVVNAIPPPSQLPTQSLPVAQAVPGLEGYVRSPFTNPPRLVDVRGMATGSKVVCPYTRRPFLVPNMPKSEVASTPAPEAPAETPREPAKPKAPEKPAVAPPTTPTKVAANTAPAPQPPPAPPAPASKPSEPAKPQPKPQQPQTQAQTKPSPAPASTPPAPPTQPAKVAAELPFGIPIPGRPGFVNSPYAAKHQLVDVTGLATGMEVKCPYTGKLFRVPPSPSTDAKK